MKKLGRKGADKPHTPAIAKHEGSLLNAPFENFSEISVFYDLPLSAREVIESVFFSFDPRNSSPIAKIFEGNEQERQGQAKDIRERSANVAYRLAFPEDKLSYWEALALAQRSHDSFLFKLVRLLGREIEKTAWFLAREMLAELREEQPFFQRYREARCNPVRWSARKSSQAARLLPLAFLEIEFRGCPPAFIFKALRTGHNAGTLSASSMPPNLKALRVYLHSLGWKTGGKLVRTEEYYEDLSLTFWAAEMRKRLARNRPKILPDKSIS